MKIIHKHNTTKEDAISKVKNHVTSILRQLLSLGGELEVSWSQNTMDFSLAIPPWSAKGNVRIDKEDLLICIQLPLVLNRFKSQLEATIHQELSTIFPTTPGK